MCSSICRKSITAVIMSYGIYIIFFILTALPVYMIEILSGYTKDVSDMIGCLLLNPAVYLAEFISRSMTRESIIKDMIGQTTSPILKWLTSGYWWMILSTAAFILVSVLFLTVAKKRISPVSRKKAKKLAGKQMA